jgi:hypothetical protein
MYFGLKLTGFSLFFGRQSICGKSIAAGGLHEVARVVDGEDADIVSPAQLETVDSAVCRDEPRRLFRVAVDRADEMQRQKTDRARMRKDRDALAFVNPEDLAQLARCAAKEVAIAFALRDDVVNIAVDERVIILRERFSRFVEGETFQNADVPFAKGRGLDDRQIEESGERFGGLDGAQKVARIDRIDLFFGKRRGGQFGLSDSQFGQGRRRVSAEPPFGISGGLSVSDKIEFGYGHR